jgi:hypothetical protein
MKHFRFQNNAKQKKPETDICIFAIPEQRDARQDIAGYEMTQ